ncbi:MAG: hypothetical protein FWG46_05435, partial [Treponema sp.]|nr:hypothetical protein [Treponema sp.]
YLSRVSDDFNRTPPKVAQPLSTSRERRFQSNATEGGATSTSNISLFGGKEKEKNKLNLNIT